MNKTNMAVLTNIIGAVESGGQVYGKRNYAAYAAPYTNSSLEHTVTLGWAQNYGSEAYRLVLMIYSKDPAAFDRIDPSGKVKTMITGEHDWVKERWKPTTYQKYILIALIDSPVGHECQDELFAELMEKYIAECEKSYTENIPAVMMYCEIRHLGGKGAADRIFKRCNGDYSLDSILASLKKDQTDTSSSNQVGDRKFWSRHQKCVEFIRKYAVSEDGGEEDTLAYTRSTIVKQAQAWIGCKESDGSHKKIIDIYNAHKPLARGYAVKYTDAWCATFVSAVSIKCGYTTIIPTECGCEELIKLFKKLGEWQENDAFVPSAGDIIFYDWQDSGSGDNTGYSDHVGIVEKVSGNNITVIEGNKNDAVARRTIKVNARYIRGYGVPKYTSSGITASTTTSTNAKSTSSGNTASTAAASAKAATATSVATIEQAAKDVIAGKYGNGDARKKAITALGLDYATVQKRVSELLKGSASNAVYYTVQKGDTLSAIAKRYGTTVSAIQKLNQSLIKNVNVIQSGWKIRVK